MNHDIVNVGLVMWIFGWLCGMLTSYIRHQRAIHKLDQSVKPSVGSFFDPGFRLQPDNEPFTSYTNRNAVKTDKEECQCIVCKKIITDDDWKEVTIEFAEIFARADGLGIESLTEEQQVLVNREVHAKCYDFLP